LSDVEDLTELILLQITSINKDVGGFVTGLLSNDLTKERQVSFGHRLVDLAELILERANGTPTMLIEGSVSDDGNDSPANRPVTTG
jgi:hypothetical protein